MRYGLFGSELIRLLPHQRIGLNPADEYSWHFQAGNGAGHSEAAWDDLPW
jgi:hypothetical protein